MKTKIILLTMLIIFGINMKLIITVDAYAWEDAIKERNWGYDAINVDEKLTGKEIKIGIVDDGIIPHDEYTISGGTDCFINPNDKENNDDLSYKACSDGISSPTGEHGMFIAGITSSDRTNGKVNGVAPKAELYAIKIYGKEGCPEDSESESCMFYQSVIRAIDWAINNHIDVLNFSNALPDPEEASTKALPNKSELKQILINKTLEAYKNGIYIVVSAGNNIDYTYIPQEIEWYNSLPTVTTVSGIYKSSVDNDYHFIEHFASGDAVDITAPGYKIFLTTDELIGDDYKYGDGTSFAAPFVTGTVALAKEKFPNYTNDDIYALLMLNTKKVEEHDNTWDEYVGYGFVQATFEKTLIKKETTLNLTASYLASEVPLWHLDSSRKELLPLGQYKSETMYIDNNGQKWYQIELENRRAMWIPLDVGKKVEEIVNNRIVLQKNVNYPERLFDDNRKNYATIKSKGELMLRFENSFHPNGIEINFYGSNQQSLEITFYDKKRSPIKTINLNENGLHPFFDEVAENIAYFGIKNNLSEEIKLAELEILGNVPSNPKKIVDFNTTITLKKDLRWFMGEDFVLGDILPKLGVKDETFTVDKGADWDDNLNGFSKVRVTNEELGIENKWLTIESGELSNIFNEDLTNRMYGQVIQSNGISSPANLLDDWTLFYPSMKHDASQTYEFDNPVSIHHMLALSTPSYLDNQLKLTLTDSNGQNFEEFIGDDELFYRYFPLSQIYENIKKVKLENLSKNYIYLTEIGYYGEPNEDVAIPTVAIEHPITLKKSGFTLYDYPLAENPTKIESLQNNITIYSIKGYGYNTSKHVYDWLQIEWNGALKWIYNDDKEVEIKAIYNHGLIDGVGVGNPIQKNVYSIYNLVNNGTSNAAFPAKSSVEYPFNTPVSMKQVYLAHGEYIDNAEINFLLELLDENKQLIYQKTITRDDLYKKLITFDETYENVKYFRLTNQTNAWHYLMEIEFK